MDRKVLGMTLPQPVLLALVVLLPIVGFVIVMLLAPGGGTTTSVDATVTPKSIGLVAGQTRTTSVIVKNPTDQGVRVASITAGSSRAAGSCAEGAVTSAEVSNPTGYIPPGGINAYVVTFKAADKIDDRCLDETLTLPLTVELASAAD